VLFPEGTLAKPIFQHVTRGKSKDTGTPAISINRKPDDSINWAFKKQ